MNPKKPTYVLASGTALLLLGAAWLNQGCTLASDACACTTEFRSQSAYIVDGQAQPVDSAAIKVFRVSDNKEIGPIDQGLFQSRKGQALIFTDAETDEFPGGKTTMEIRVVATKGTLSGEERYVMGIDGCGCHFEKVSGRDTITVR
jgi:hypothetical protein